MLISAESLSFSYGVLAVLREASFDVGEGEYILLRGESGCGKSTLLRLLAKLESASGGTLRFRGDDYVSIPATSLRRKVAYLQQLPVMIQGSIRENLLLSFRFAPHDRSGTGSGLPTAEAPGELLARANLNGLDLDAPAGALSVGQKQRIAMLRLLLMNPDVLLLDEPTASLDAASAGIIHAWLRELHEDEGKTIVHVTHAERHAFSPSVRRWTMENGRITEGPE